MKKNSSLGENADVDVLASSFDMLKGLVPKFLGVVLAMVEEGWRFVNPRVMLAASLPVEGEAKCACIRLFSCALPATST